MPILGYGAGLGGGTAEAVEPELLLDWEGTQAISEDVGVTNDDWEIRPLTEDDDKRWLKFTLVINNVSQTERDLDIPVPSYSVAEWREKVPTPVGSIGTLRGIDIGSQLTGDSPASAWKRLMIASIEGNKIGIGAGSGGSGYVTKLKLELIGGPGGSVPVSIRDGNTDIIPEGATNKFLLPANLAAILNGIDNIQVELDSAAGEVNVRGLTDAQIQALTTPGLINGLLQLGPGLSAGVSGGRLHLDGRTDDEVRGLFNLATLQNVLRIAPDTGITGSIQNGVWTWSGRTDAEVQALFDLATLKTVLKVVADSGLTVEEVGGEFRIRGRTDAEVQSLITVAGSSGLGGLAIVDGALTYAGPTAATIRALFAGGTGIDVAADGTISLTDASGQPVAGGGGQLEDLLDFNPAATSELTNVRSDTDDFTLLNGATLVRDLTEADDNSILFVTAAVAQSATLDEIPMGFSGWTFAREWRQWADVADDTPRESANSIALAGSLSTTINLGSEEILYLSKAANRGLVALVGLLSGQSRYITRLKMVLAPVGGGSGSTSNFTLSDHTTDDLPQGVVNLYWLQSRFDAAFAAKTSDDLTEGPVNKYASRENVLAVIEAGTGIAISDEGVISVEGTTPATGSPWTTLLEIRPDVNIGNTGGALIAVPNSTFSPLLTSDNDDGWIVFKAAVSQESIDPTHSDETPHLFGVFRASEWRQLPEAAAGDDVDDIRVLYAAGPLSTAESRNALVVSFAKGPSDTVLANYDSTDIYLTYLKVELYDPTFYLVGSGDGSFDLTRHTSNELPAGNLHPYATTGVLDAWLGTKTTTNFIEGAKKFVGPSALNDNITVGGALTKALSADGQTFTLSVPESSGGGSGTIDTDQVLTTLVDWTIPQQEAGSDFANINGAYTLINGPTFSRDLQPSDDIGLLIFRGSAEWDRTGGEVPDTTPMLITGIMLAQRWRNFSEVAAGSAYTAVNGEALYGHLSDVSNNSNLEIMHITKAANRQVLMSMVGAFDIRLSSLKIDLFKPVATGGGGGVATVEDESITLAMLTTAVRNLLGGSRYYENESGINLATAIQERMFYNANKKNWGRVTADTQPIAEPMRITGDASGLQPSGTPFTVRGWARGPVSSLVSAAHGAIALVTDATGNIPDDLYAVLHIQSGTQGDVLIITRATNSDTAGRFVMTNAHGAHFDHSIHLSVNDGTFKRWILADQMSTEFGDVLGVGIDQDDFNCTFNIYTDEDVSWLPATVSVPRLEYLAKEEAPHTENLRGDQDFMPKPYAGQSFTADGSGDFYLGVLSEIGDFFRFMLNRKSASDNHRGWSAQAANSANREDTGVVNGIDYDPDENIFEVGANDTTTTLEMFEFSRDDKHNGRPILARLLPKPSGDHPSDAQKFIAGAVSIDPAHFSFTPDETHDEDDFTLSGLGGARFRWQPGRYYQIDQDSRTHPDRDQAIIAWKIKMVPDHGGNYLHYAVRTEDSADFNAAPTTGEIAAGFARAGIWEINVHSTERDNAHNYCSIAAFLTPSELGSTRWALMFSPTTEDGPDWTIMPNRFNRYAIDFDSTLNDHGNQQRFHYTWHNINELLSDSGPFNFGQDNWVHVALVRINGTATDANIVQKWLAYPHSHLFRDGVHLPMTVARVNSEGTTNDQIHPRIYYNLPAYAENQATNHTVKIEDERAHYLNFKNARGVHQVTPRYQVQKLDPSVVVTSRVLKDDNTSAIPAGRDQYWKLMRRGGNVQSHFSLFNQGGPSLPKRGGERARIEYSEQIIGVNTPRIVEAMRLSNLPNAVIVQGMQHADDTQAVLRVINGQVGNILINHFAVTIDNGANVGRLEFRYAAAELKTISSVTLYGIETGDKFNATHITNTRHADGASDLVRYDCDFQVSSLGAWILFTHNRFVAVVIDINGEDEYATVPPEEHLVWR